MKTFLKILIPLLFCFTANSQSITRLTGDTTVANSNNGATLFQIKNNTAYRTGGYLQNYLGGRSKWNFAIDSAYSLGGVLYLVRSTHDTIPIAISGTVGVSSVAAGFGTDFSTITTTGSVKVDSFVMATRLRVQKQIDSLGSVIGVGSVTNVSPGFGTNFTPITSTGNVIVDSFTIATRLRVKKQIDSLSALLSSYVPVARTITSGFGLTGGTQDLSANRTISTDSFSVATRARLQKSIDSLDAILSGYLTTTLSNGNFWVGNGSNIATSVTPTGDVTFDNTGAFAIGSGKVTNTMLAGSIANNKLLNSTISGVSLGSNLNALSNGYGITTLNYNGSTTGSAAVDSFSIASRARVQKPIDSLGVIIATKGVGSVTSVAAGYGLNFTTITGSGSVISDTFAMATRARVQKPIDSLGVVIATKGSGTVTNVGSGFGTVFSAITTTGNVIIDSFTMATRARMQKPVDSLDAAIVAGYVPVTRTVAGFALSGNITLASLTQGYGLAFSSGSTYNASTGITERVDTALMSTIANRDKLKDSLGSVLGNYWNLSGNSLTAGSQAGSFLGSTNNVSVRVRSNNVEVAKFDSTGSELYLENGLNPLISLKQKITAKEWQIRGNVGNGSSSQNFNIYDATNSKIAINISDYRHIAFGDVTSIPTSSQIYGFGGSLGANLDMRPDSLVNDDANIEVENAAYDDGSSPFLGYGLAIEHSGNKATGNTFVYSNKNLSQLRFTATTNLIRVINNASLRFGTNSTEYMVLDSNGRLGIGNKLPTYTLDVTGTSRITSTFYLSGNSYNSGAALVALAIDTLTGIVYRKTASGGSSGITIGSTSITSGTNTRILYNNSGVVGEYTVTGTGTTAVLSTSPDFTTGITIGSVAVPTISSTNTFTNKRWTARVGSTTSSGTPTINTDNTDIYKLTAQAAAITSFTTNLSGTPVDGDALEIQITDDGTARAITWGASFVNGTVSLPVTTVISTTLTVDLKYYSTSSFGTGKWVCVAYY